MGLFRSKIMLVISCNLFFQWYLLIWIIYCINKNNDFNFVKWFRLVQNLVFYGVSQSTGKSQQFENHEKIFIILNFKGSWKLDPYLSFFLSACVEFMAYVLVHLILDRIGRKLPYCLFAVLFGIVALLILPVQQFTEKTGTNSWFCLFMKNKIFHFSPNYIIDYNKYFIKIFRISILCYYIHICKWTFPNKCTKYRNGHLFNGCTYWSNYRNLF